MDERNRTDSALEQFRAALIQRGLVPPAEIQADGAIHRCDADGRKGRKDGAYLLHLDGIPAGGIENHRDGRGWENWRADIGRTFAAEEEAAHLAKVETMRRAREAEAKRRASQAAKRAKALWAEARPAPADHAYLAKKGVQAHGLRVYRGPMEISGKTMDGALLVPIADSAGRVQSLQLITPEGDKLFLPGGKLPGYFYLLGTLDDPAGPLVVAEGFATGASLFEATGWPVAVAFNAGNLAPVALALSAQPSEAQLIIAADDDTARPTIPA